MREFAKRHLPPWAKVRIRRGLKYLAKARKQASQPDRTLSQQDQQLNKDVTSLSQALWMGFSADATADLEQIRRTGAAVARKPIARAAETLARWYATNADHELALERIILARALNGRNHPERLLVLEHHLLTELGLFEGANRIFENYGTASPDLHLMQANLHLREAELGLVSREEADKKRLVLIDWLFRRHALIPISELIGDGVLEFAALGHGRPLVMSEDVDASDPIVSIVVPAYNAESTLATSVNSLRAQTFPHIQILIVDDASTDNTSAIAKELAAEDSRITVIQHSSNRGAYGARNTGLMNAASEYFTVHDADDWSHPQRIERQLAVLDNQRTAGSFSRLARVTPEMKYLLRPYRPMLEPIHWNYTSLLARTETLRKFGGWDPVRAHADSDLIERLRDYYGKDSIPEVDVSVPLSFFSVSGSNLTESKDTGLRSVHFGSRKEYIEQARFWRTKTFADGEIPTYNGHQRYDAKSPFYCARSLAPNRDQTSRSYDLVIGSDLALTGGTRRCNLAYIDCARRLGLRVGIFNMPRYRLRGAGNIDVAYREMFQEDGIDLLCPEDEVTARTLLVHHPPVLRKAFEGYPNVSADRHYLLVNQLPWNMKDYSDVQYDAMSVHGRYAEAFEDEPVWIPISPRVRRYLSRELAAELLHDEDWYPIVSWEPRGRHPGTRRLESLPVVGRHSRDHETKWPESAEVLEKCYLAGTEYQVVLLGGVAGADRVLGYRPRNWVVHPFDSISVQDFLAGIDVFVHFHHSTYIEEFGRNIAEAMAMGIVCVLPPEYSETFEDAALYAKPYDVVQVIRDVWADQDRYREYSNRGVEFVKRLCAPDTGMRHIKSLLP